MKPISIQVSNTMKLMKSTTTLSINIQNRHVISQMFNPCIWIPKLICILMSIFHYTYSAANLRQWTKTIFYEENYEPPTTKYKQKLNKRNKNKIIIQTLLLISSIPQFELSIDQKLSSNFDSFLNQNGILQTNKLPKIKQNLNPCFQTITFKLV